MKKRQTQIPGANQNCQSANQNKIKIKIKPAACPVLGASLNRL
jgi:hypothetical protein